MLEVNSALSGRQRQCIFQISQNKRKVYSVIIPHFNDYVRLSRLLESIPLGREDLEVLVVDDCSPDQDKINNLRAHWTSVFWLSTLKNSGAGAARNLGLQASTARWLLFADADDEFVSGAFDTFDRVLESCDQLVYFKAEGIQEIDSRASSRPDQINKLLENYILSPSKKSDLDLRLNHMVPWAKVYSRDFIFSLNLRFDETFYGNDVAFNVLAAMQARIVRVQYLPIYRVYRRPNSLTADLSTHVFMQRFLVSLSVAKRLADLGFGRVWSGTGHLLEALQYGPYVTIKICCLVLQSPMKVNIFRLLELKRWCTFYRDQLKKKREIRKF